MTWVKANSNVVSTLFLFEFFLWSALVCDIKCSMHCG